MDEIREFTDIMKSLQNHLLEFIERENNSEENYQNFDDIFNEQKISNDQCNFKSFIHILLQIANNHYRTPNFFSKIDKIILTLKDEIKQKFSNSQIFNFFKSNKRILLFLIKEKILVIDHSITNIILNDTKFNVRNYIQYFFIENEIIQNFSIENSEVFDEKREIGENDDTICTIIRNDLIDEFISFVKKNDYPLNSQINQSIFETNNFLLKNEPTLIEYAAFFGSTQIFKYLYLNGVELIQSIWIYAIHSDNPEMIHLLIEMNIIKPDDESYQKCLKESIKCHHNDIANYIINNLIDQDNYQLGENYNDNIVAYGFKYHNYSFFPNDFNHKFIFFYSCQYDYLKIVRILLQTKQINIKGALI